MIIQKLTYFFNNTINLGCKKFDDPELDDTIKITNTIALFTGISVSILSFVFIENKIVFLIYLLFGPLYFIFIYLNKIGKHKISRIIFSFLAPSILVLFNAFTSNDIYLFVIVAGISTVVLPSLLFTKTEIKPTIICLIYIFILCIFLEQIVAYLPIVYHFDFEVNWFNQNLVIIGNALFSMSIIFVAIYNFKSEKENFRFKILEKNHALKTTLEELHALNENLEKLVSHRTIKLNELNNQLNIKNERLRHFLFSNSHEIRPHVANMLGLSDLIIIETNVEKRSELISLLHDSAKKLDEAIHKANERLNDVK